MSAPPAPSHDCLSLSLCLFWVSVFFITSGVVCVFLSFSESFISGVRLYP